MADGEGGGGRWKEEKEEEEGAAEERSPSFPSFLHRRLSLRENGLVRMTTSKRSTQKKERGGKKRTQNRLFSDSERKRIAPSFFPST